MPVLVATDVGVVLRRQLGEEPELKTYLGNAPADTAHETLVWLLGLCRPVVQAIKEGKEELRLDRDEVRGWHHHTTMSLLAQGFMVRLRSRVGGKGTCADCAANAAAQHHPAGSPPGRRGHPRAVRDTS